jgi:hypothetical protein
MHTPPRPRLIVTNPPPTLTDESSERWNRADSRFLQIVATAALLAWLGFALCNFATTFTVVP